MFWNNKTFSTKRLSGGSYNTYLSNLKGRYEPNLPSGTEQKYYFRSEHVLFLMYCVPSDIIVSDRIVIGSDEWVVVRASHYRDTLWKHDELLIRKIDSSEVHMDVTLKKLSGVQPNYDDYYKEYVDDGKAFTTSTISVMLDPITTSRNFYIEIMDSWKLEGVEYFAIVDHPTVINKEDKIMIGNDQYEIKRIEPRPYDILVALQKTKVSNYNVA